MAEFVRVARTSEIPPGSGKAFDIGDRSVAVFNVAGEFYAIDNQCPHAGAPLAGGFLVGDEITCPWHQWVFNVKTGCFVMHPASAVDTFALKVENGDIFVAMAER